MDYASCQEALLQTQSQNYGQYATLSSLTQAAWGKDQAECFRAIGGSRNIERILDGKELMRDDATTQTGLVTTGTVADTSYLHGLWDQTLSVLMYIGYGIVGLICIYLVFRLLRKGLKFMYALLNKRRMVFIKVALPRGEGKVDMEQAKELAKDMKERIARMVQVYENWGRIGDLTASDKVMHTLFGKGRISCIYHYEKGKLSFILGTYPEYLHIVKGAINSQYADATIEAVAEPKYFSKKYSTVIPLEQERDSIYTIKLFKQSPDDQINNIIDSISNISPYDTVSIVMNLSPIGEEWSEDAKNKVSRLYKNLDIGSTRLRWLNPLKLFSFLFKGYKARKREEDVTMVRMVKSQEDTFNAMAEEAGNSAFKGSIMIIISSDSQFNATEGMHGIYSAYSVYTDEYGNEFRHPHIKADILGFISKPLRKFAVKFLLLNVFFKKSIFTSGELASLFHFPARIYNRSSIIDWMPFKVLSAPDNVPVFNEENGYIMSGMLAESYRGGQLSSILSEKEYDNHRAIGDKTTTEQKLIPLEQASKKEKKYGTVIEQDGKKFVQVTVQKHEKGFKLYKEGVLLGVNVFKNRFTPVYMKRNDRTRHFYCIGKSGTGKSVFLQTLARQDVWNGDGLCLIDPHGDLADDMLEYIPKERAKDVIYFDAGNDERPMGLNLYEINSLDEADRVVNDATEIFLKMFGPEIFGPRIQEYFKYGSLTLLEDFEDRPTLLDVVRLFTDEVYRQYKLKKVTNPVVKNWREKTFNAMGDREKQEIIPYFSAKFVSFNTNRLIRNIIGQTKSAFNIEEIMNSNKILLINLSKGKIGELNTQLLGMILVSKIYNGAMARAKIDPKERKDFYLYVDEFQNFVSGTFADILSEARKYRLSLIMAHQYIGQLEGGGGNNIGDKGGGKNDVKSAVFGNVGTMMSFKVGAPDAEFLEKEFTPILSAGDIVGIANYKAYIKLNIDNATSLPFSMTSVYSQDYRNKKIPPILKEYCAKKYGRKREFVDAEISARLGVGIDDAALNQAQTDNTEQSVEASQQDDNSNNTTNTPPLDTTQ